MKPVLETMAKVAEAELSLDLGTLLHQLHTDGAPGSMDAARQVWPRLQLMRDVRHVMKNVLECGHGSVDLRKWIQSQIWFTASALMWNPPLASLFLDAVMARLVEQGELDLPQYMQTSLLREARGRGMWEADWLSVSSLSNRDYLQSQTKMARRGFTACSVSQCMESFWADVKKGAPDTRVLPMDKALQAVLASIQACCACSTARSQPISVQFDDILQRLVSGDVIWCERMLLPTEEGSQQIRLPSVGTYLLYAPGNFARLRCDIAEVNDVARIYVVPLSQASMEIPLDVALCLCDILKCADDTCVSTVSWLLLQHAYSAESSARACWVRWSRGVK